MNKKEIKFLIILLIFGLSGCMNIKKENSILDEKIAIAENEEKTSAMFFSMDTYMQMEIYQDKCKDILIQAAQKILSLENMLSVTNPDSEIYMINNRKTQEKEISEELSQFIEKALLLCKKTQGNLDISIYPILKEWGFTTGEYKVPSQARIDELIKYVGYRNIKLEKNKLLLAEGMQIDMGAVAKGYSADCAVDIMRKNGVKSAILNLGGNVYALGSKPNGSPWRVAIKNPDNQQQYLGYIEVQDKAVITSGGYERYFTDENGKIYWHIIDSFTGYPADSGLISVTVIGENSMKCDALSTALFVMGKDKAIEMWREENDFEMILVSQDREIFITEGVTAAFTLTDKTKKLVEVKNAQ